MVVAAANIGEPVDAKGIQKLVTLVVNVPAPTAIAAECELLRANNRDLEQRVSREAQRWAQQRATLVKERAELEDRLAEREAYIWKLTKGESEFSGNSQQMVAKRKIVKDVGSTGKQPVKKGLTAMAATRGGKTAMPKPLNGGRLGPAKRTLSEKTSLPEMASAEKASFPSATKQQARNGEPCTTLPAGAEADEIGAIEINLAAAKPPEAKAATEAALGAVTGNNSTSSGTAGEGDVSHAPVCPDSSGPSTVLSMVSAASAMINVVFGSSSSDMEQNSTEAPAQPANIPEQKALLGHRRRPEWVPALVDFRRAMVRSPRRKKQSLAGGEAGAKNKQQGIKRPGAAKQQARHTARIPYELSHSCVK